MKYDFIVGIDTGVNTGIAKWDVKDKKLLAVTTMMIHQAMDSVLLSAENANIFVRFEDARLRKWFGKAGKEQLQGAGSIKRDAKIWEDFLTDMGIPFEMVAPKNNKTKLTADTFKRITGWGKMTNVHNRDAAMLVFNYICPTTIG